ncbi:MAG: LacI family transcriptional regulator [Actinomycetota bacterium]|nr:LacI family transcriptional regulator [Actinomycetota bacterium]
MKALTDGPGAQPGRAAVAQGAAARGLGRDATIYQVADRARVSIATVSRVLRGTTPVADETRRRVLAAVDELRFTPSRSARSLAEGQHAANGIVFPDLSGPYFAEVVLGYEEVAAELGRSVLILTTHGRQAARQMVLDLASRVDGLVILGRTVGDEVLADLTARGLPLVLMARDPVAGADTVNAENSESARVLTEHLVHDHGYRSFAFLGDATTSTDTSQRWAAFRTVLREAKVPGPRAPTPCAFDEEGGRIAADRLLRRKRPRVLVCANDEIALGAVLAAEALGLRVPDDLAVTGWDDVMAARHSRPGLTTVRQPMRELGAWAARRLHERLAGDASEPRHEVLPTQLVQRASCGCHQEENR